MLMALCTLTRGGVEAMLFYLVAYLFTNLGAFAIVAFLRNQTHSEDLEDFRGLVRRSPMMVVTLSFFLLSLLGIPPLVGFAAKFQVFAVLWKDGTMYYDLGEPGLGATLIGLLIVGGLNTVISAVFYLKVMKVMILDRRAEDLEGTDPPRLHEPLATVAYSLMLTGVVLFFGIFWGPIDSWSRTGITRFRQQPGVDPAASGAPAGGGGAAGGADAE
jgi:NADH-quinone oxidoreductase subunit N